MFVQSKDGEVRLCAEDDNEKLFLELVLAVAARGGYLHAYRNPIPGLPGKGLDLEFAGDPDAAKS